MAITRATLVNDDGSGTHGTIVDAAFITALYDAIDALVGPIVSSGAWTPVDGSGAGLTLTYPDGATWVKVAGLVFVQAAVLYPSTADGSGALIGGLPFTSWGFQGGGSVSYTTLAALPTVLVGASDTKIQLFKPGGATLLNSDMSGKDLRFNAIYRT